MSDFKDTNAAILSALTTVYGAEPGLKFNTSLGFDFMLEWSRVAYEKLGLTPLQTAAAYTDLAHQMMRVGYSDKAHFIAEYSNGLVRNLDEPAAHDLATFNHSIHGYSQFINGHYQAALASFEHVDQLMMSTIYNPMRAIKSFQNKGQILHRMGMENVIYYPHAMDQFTHAQNAIDRDKTLAPDVKAQFTSQVQYCQGKTMTHMARIAITDGQLLAGEAVRQLGAAVELVRGKARFDFERACLHTVLGDALTVQNKPEMAREYLESGLKGQMAFGATLAPRIAATMFKIERLNGLASISAERQHQIIGMLANFHGHQKHPDIAYYNREIEKAKQAATPKAPGL